jgi:tetrahydromethanopterin S-methyltransferase subunit F
MRNVSTGGNRMRMLLSGLKIGIFQGLIGGILAVLLVII